MVSTPPRGWNSYDAFTWRVTEAEFLENCEYVSTHLLEHGFEFCVIDYLWFQVRGYFLVFVPTIRGIRHLYREV
eukprot:SAG31_NODE_2518_length_5574_cov_9.105205_5_plen_74_part_00